MDKNFFQKRNRKSVVNISADVAVPTSSTVEYSKRVEAHQRRCTEKRIHLEETG